MKYPLIAIDGIVEAYAWKLETGIQIDDFLLSQMYNFVEVARRLPTAIELLTANPYLWKRLATAANHVYDVAAEKVLAAEYPPREYWPFCRLYLCRYGDYPAISREALLAQWAEAPIKVGTADLMVRYSDPAQTTRAAEWMSRMRLALGPSTMIAEGRIRNTQVTKTHVLYRRAGGCVICGAASTGNVASTLYEPACAMYVAHTCKSHQEFVRRSPSVLHFIFSLFQLQLDLGTVLRSSSLPDSIIAPMCEILARELEAVALPTVRKKDHVTITLTRSSGYRVIFRLKTLLDYAYVVLDSHGIPRKRVDAAPHHFDLQYFPDHVHLTPTTDNANVVSSFTYGFPLLDLPTIRRLLAELEFSAPDPYP